MSASNSAIAPAIVTAANAKRTANPSLKERALRASLWTVAGYGAGQILRLGSNLILTRLLFPEAFGLMALVQVFMQGLQMFSDIGIGPSIIQNEHGDEPTFLNTAWTLQLFRGVVLWGCVSVLAWPAAAFYDQTALAWLLPLSGLTLVVDGFRSTRAFTLNRQLQVRRLAIVALISQIVGIAGMVIWALVRPDVLALVAGGLIASFARTLLSHLALPGICNRFLISRDALRSLLTFGRWVFLSTLLTFVAVQADRMIFGKLMSLELFGVYGVALVLSQVPLQIISAIESSVVFPALSRARSVGMDLSRPYTRIGAISATLGGTAVAMAFVFARPLVELMYDDRYAAAGWMLQLLMIGVWFRILQLGNGSALLALGLPKWIAASNIAKLIALSVALPVGYKVAGIPGAILAIGATEIVKYAVCCTGTALNGLDTIKKDLGVSSYLIAVVAGTEFLAGSLSLLPGEALLLRMMIIVPLCVPLLWLAYKSIRSHG